MAKLNVKKTTLQKQTTGIRLQKKELGEGGNARVFPGVRNADGQSVAVKFLLNADPKRYSRFRDEVLVVTERLLGSPAVLPILEHDLSKPPSAEFIPFYVMPRAEGLWNRVGGMTWRERLEGLVHMADALVELHRNDVAHRDIKPENLFFWEGLYRFGDFGIAHFPEKSGVTTESEPMGPAGYMAPEMESATSDRDALKADVYSMAKTVWAVLANRKSPFSGQYLPGRWTSLEKLVADKDFVHEPLEDLLHRATDIDPNRRPSAAEFAAEMRRVADAQGDFSIANTLQWRAAEVDVLGQFGASRVEWHEVSAIANVLSDFSRRHGMNHLFFPEGGGLTVASVSICEGGKMLALHFEGGGGIAVVKPFRLTLERFGNDPQFSYVVLETEGTTKLDVKETYEGYQELRLLNDFDYAPVRTSDYDENYVEQPGRRCSRYFEPGVFVISPTTGVYNRIDDYMGTGHKLGRDRLRLEWQKLFNKVSRSAPRDWLMRETRLLQWAEYADADLNLQYIDDDLLKKLIRLDDKLVEKRNTERKGSSGMRASLADTLESMSAPPSPEETEAATLLSAMTKPALAEYLALICIGRGSASPNELAVHVDTFKDNTFDNSYYKQKLGSGLLRKAVQKFGYTIRLDEHS